MFTQQPLKNSQFSSQDINSVQTSTNTPPAPIMKKLFIALAAVAALCATATAQTYSGPLVKYDMNNNANYFAPSYLSSCVTATSLTKYGISNSYHSAGGSGNATPFACFSGWDTVNDYSFARTNLSQYADTLAFDVTASSSQIATVSGISLNYARQSSTSVDKLIASIFWVDNSGVVQYRTTGVQTLTGTQPTWNTLNLAFTSGSAALPTGLGALGEKYHVELYAYGQSAGVLYLDNISLNGTCAPIPEPAGAMLLGSAGLAFLIRRRSRR